MIAGGEIDGVVVHDGLGASSIVALRRDTEALIFGSPDVRERSEPLPEDDGIVDMTIYYEPREGVISGKVRAAGWDDYYTRRDQIRRLFDLQVGLDHTFTVTLLNGDVKNLIFRANGRLDVEQIGNVPSFQWSCDVRAADPRWYGTLRSVTYDPLGTPLTGRSYPKVYPKDYGGTGATAGTINNAGGSSSPASLLIEGPWTNPWVVNDTTGVAVYTQGTSLVAADDLVIDTRLRTVTLNGVAAPSLVDWARSRWLYLRSGANAFRVGGTYSSGAAVTISGYDAGI